MRYRTAAVASLSVIAVLYGFPWVVTEFLIPNLHNPVPLYQQFILEAAFFCLSWRFFLTLPAIAVFFVIAAFTQEPAPRHDIGPTVPRRGKN